LTGSTTRVCTQRQRSPADVGTSCQIPSGAPDACAPAKASAWPGGNIPLKADNAA
jgi:hypothetical protein